jgi:F0F1-type ATP synthase membrane subunit b/b'
VSSQTYVTIAIWSQVISAIVFIAALGYLWFRYLQPIVLAAQARSNEQIAEAERHRDDAKAALSALREEIEGADRDAVIIRERAARQAQRERISTLAEANDAGERLVRNARGEFERARAAARERLRGELLTRALDAARSEATHRIDASANERLVNVFLTSLERSDAR